MDFAFHVGSNGASQVAAIRAAVTEETRQIRFDDGFYGLCKPGSDFRVLLHPERGDATRKVALDSSSVDLMRPASAATRWAIANEPHKVSKQSKLAQVFHVAELLRFDHIATRVEQSVRATAGGLGASRPAADRRTPALVQAAGPGQRSRLREGLAAAASEPVQRRPTASTNAPNRCAATAFRRRTRAQGSQAAGLSAPHRKCKARFRTPCWSGWRFCRATATMSFCIRNRGEIE